MMPLVKKPSRTRIRENLSKFNTEFDERPSFYEEECDEVCEEFEEKKKEKLILSKKKAKKEKNRKKHEGNKRWEELP